MIKKLLTTAAILGGSLVSANTITLDSDNSLAFVGQVNNSSVSQFLQDFLTYEGDEVFIYIDSGGGSVVAMNHLISVMRASGKKTTCFADYAASAAFTMLQACDVRVASPTSSILMQHYGSYSLRHQPSNLQRSMVDMLETLMEDFVENERERIGNYTHEEYVDIIKNDWWLVGHRALESNVVDKLAHVTCTPELTKSKVKEEFSFFGMTIDVTFSGCPLIKTPLSVVIRDVGEEGDVEQIERDFREHLKSLRAKDLPEF